MFDAFVGCETFGVVPPLGGRPDDFAITRPFAGISPNPLSNRFCPVTFGAKKHDVATIEQRAAVFDLDYMIAVNSVSGTTAAFADPASPPDQSSDEAAPLLRKIEIIGTLGCGLKPRVGGFERLLSKGEADFFGEQGTAPA